MGKKIKMTVSESITFKEGCEMYLDNCRQRNLREGTVNHYRQSYVQFCKYFEENMLILKCAKAKGTHIGRPSLTKDEIPQIFYRHYPAYKNNQLNISELAKVCGMSRTTIYKYIDIIEN